MVDVSAPGTGTVRSVPLHRVAVWVVGVGAASLWGHLALDAGARLGAPPLKGSWDWHPGWRLLPAVVVAAAVVAGGPRVAARWRWRSLLAAVGTVAVAWAVTLAVSDGWPALARPLMTHHELLPFARALDDPVRFVDTYTSEASGYPVHVQGHPPGAVLVFAGLDRLALGSTEGVALAVLAAGGVMSASALVACRVVAGEPTARRAAPFVALSPAAVWMGTAPDAVYGAVAAAGIALVVAAAAGMVRSMVWSAAGGGALLAASLHLTYGAAPLMLLPLGVVLVRRAWTVARWAAAAAVLVTGAWLAAGFWWLEGLAVTRDFYEAGVASARPYAYFTVAGNPAALALAVGPVAAAVPWIRARGLLLPGLALAGVVSANLSGLSKGEVERIWLPFVPWLLLGAGTAMTSRRIGVRRTWLGAQAAAGLALQAVLRSPW